MDFPDDRRYTKEHEWIKLEDDGSSAKIGITDYAQGELGDVVFVELNDVGNELAADDVFGTVEAVKTVSDLFMPVAGTITAINQDLDANPELVNDSPYDGGWMVKVSVNDASDLEDLLPADEYRAMVAE